MSGFEQLEQQRKSAFDRIHSLSMDEDADPLAVYDEFVQCTLKTYQDHSVSGLVEVLEECLRKYKDDPRYTGAEFRYVMLWIHFANHVQRASVVFAHMMDKGIGKLYSAFFQCYSESLEREGRYDEAETILGLGVRTQAKPLKQLQQYQTEYLTRRKSNIMLPAKDLPFKQTCSDSLKAILTDPLRNIVSKSRDRLQTVSQDVTMTTTHNLPTPAPASKSNPYAHLNAPPATNKRPEKLMFDLTLLLEPDGTEYSFMEARARYLGLLGKKWPPPPPPNGTASSTVSNGTKERSVKVDFNDQGTKSIRLGRRQSVTINTKQALEDVFDMYNATEEQPEVAPLVQTPSNRLPVLPDESTVSSVSSKLPAFQPFIDAKQENSTPAAPKFRAISKTPISATTSNDGRKALAVKDIVTPIPPFKVVRAYEKTVTPVLRELHPLIEETNVFDREDTTTEVTEEFTNFPPPPPPPRSFVPFVDNAEESRRPFPVYKEDNVFTIARDENIPPPPKIPKFQVQRDENKRLPFFRPQRQEHQDQIDNHQVIEDRRPVMTRFANFDVMTPITERTCELTTSTRATDTPVSELSGTFEKGLLATIEAHNTATRLAAELKEEECGERELRQTGSSKSAGDVFLTFNPPNPCNPSDPVIVNQLLSLFQPDPNHRNVNHNVANHLYSLQRFAEKRAKPRSSGGLNGREESLNLDLDGDEYEVLEKLGEGGFGAVFMARDLGRSYRRMANADDDDFSIEEAEDDLVAIKAVRPTNLWELYVLRRILASVSPGLRRSIVQPQTLYAYKDESFLVLSLCRQGTLLDIVNRASEISVGPPGGGGLEELLVIFFTIELLRLLEGLHIAGFIHGDLKIDNCLIRLDEVNPANAWSSEYSPNGSGGWSSKGLTLIDFGRTIDTRLYPAGQTFIADWKTDARDCAEMRAGRPWTFQTDYAGLASIVYCMLFGRYIETTEMVMADGSKKVRPVQAMKRYWQTEMWNRLFDVLLNPGRVAGGMGGIRSELCRAKEEMEEYLRVNCNSGGKNLKGMLKKIEVVSLSRVVGKR